MMKKKTEEEDKEVEEEDIEEDMEAEKPSAPYFHSQLPCCFSALGHLVICTSASFPLKKSDIRSV